MIVDTGIKHLYGIELPTPLPVGPITVYLADAPGEPLTLIDTGPLVAETRMALEAGLDSLGYAVADLAQIVITHAHVDHFGLAADLVTASHARVLSHAWNIPALSDHDSYRKQRTDFYRSLLQQAGVPDQVLRMVDDATRAVNRYARPVAVDATLLDGDLVRLAGHVWQVLHTPGHATGLICLYEPSTRTLLSSDHLLADISSNPVVEPPPPGESERPRSLVLYRKSLQRVAEMDIRQALPSHGPIIHDVAGLVRQRLDFHEQRMERVLEAIQNGAKTTWEITEDLFPNRSPLDTFLAVSEVIGHLDLLEMEGKILPTDRTHPIDRG
jgi:glyoxylase-like metal-dependent hydrolase (beta-lactamase superfamily II)